MAVGRLTRQKGFDILIEAFSNLRMESEMTPVLLFVGDGEERGSLEAQASGMVEEGFVRFLGQRDDVANLLGASDAFVLSSLWEGGPLVVLEAMAAGVPVVATRVGDASNMVVEGETGVLVQPGDVADLAGAMRKVMEQGQEASQWGLRGKERVESKYNYGRTQRSMEEFYRSLARPGRNG
jgi:glycosyltransferase involved in cell wall biosynthesis